MKDAPLPVYNSPRLVGLELEYDSGNTNFRSPSPMPPNWAVKYDGSLDNGREFVLEPAVVYNEVRPHIETFTNAFDPIKIGLTSRGGYHVHVQAADYTTDQAFSLMNLYTHFQPVINELLAKSRANNRFCMPFTRGMTKAALVDEFKLNHPATNRSYAKNSRTYRVINFAMLRCETPEHRSIEFRQGSPSKRFANIFGWATFVTALTDMARDPELVTMALECPKTLAGLLEVVKEWEQQHGCQNLGEWLKWRHEIMNQQPTPEMVQALLEFMTVPRGLFSIATHLNINYPTVLRLVEKAVNDGLITHAGRNRYRSLAVSNEVAQEELNRLTAMSHAVSATA